MRQHRPRQVHQTEHVGVEQIAVHIHFNPSEFGLLGSSGIIDQHIQLEEKFEVFLKKI